MLLKISELTNISYKKFVINDKDRRGKDHSYKLSSSKIRKELMWTDKISLDKGLNRTLLWIKDNYKELKYRSLKRSEDFSWDYFCQNLIQIITNLHKK